MWDVHFYYNNRKLTWQLQVFWGAFVPLSFDWTAEEWTGNRGERGNDTQQRATRWNRTRGCCSENTASGYGVPALATEPLGALRREF